MSAAPSQNARIDRMEDTRDRIIDVLGKDLTKLGVKELALLERTVTNGVATEVKKQQLDMQRKSDAGEEAYRQAATAFINQRGELGRRMAQAIKEGELEGGSAALPEVPTKKLGEGENLIGQFQVGIKMLTGEEAFDASKATPPPARDSLPDIP